MSELPPPQVPVSADRPRPWWKKKRWIIPAAVVLVLVIAAIASPSDDDGDDNVAATATTIVAEPTSTTTAAATSTTRAATTTTDAPRTTTTVTATTTTTTLAPTTTVFTAEAQQALVISTFESNRLQLIQAMEDQFSLVDRVDRFEIDPTIPAYVVDLTSRFSTESFQNDLAWEITGELAILWEAATLAATPDFQPGLVLTMDGRQHACSAEFMAQLADRRVTRQDWDAAC